MHKTEPNFRLCLKLGAAEKVNGTERLFNCLRETTCAARFDFGGRKFCKIPLSEGLHKDEKKKA